MASYLVTLPVPSLGSYFAICLLYCQSTAMIVY